MTRRLCILTVFAVCCLAAEAQTVRVRTDRELQTALSRVQPGARIHLLPGEYRGGMTFATLQGRPGEPIIIAAADPARPPVIRGGANGFQLIGAQYLTLENLVFVDQTGNGLNLDDGGRRDGSSHHLALINLQISNTGPTGNRDGIKMSGVRDFQISGCTIQTWGSGGSGIDLVGCQRGSILQNNFRGRGTPEGNAIQLKGGTGEITVTGNRIENAGGRSINIGGSTGLQFFRPPLEASPEGRHAEAYDITVEANLIIGSMGPIAFVGVDGAQVRYNTIVLPERWTFRILQETRADGFVPCRRGVVSHNIIYYRTDQVREDVNIGPGTSPETFSFSNNAWFAADRPGHRPTLPVTETGGIYGQDPRFADAERGDYSLRRDSALRHLGAYAERR